MTTGAEGTPPKVRDEELSIAARDWIDRRIRAEFDRDRQYLKDLGGLAAKVIWGAISAVTIIVAIAGFRTYREVNTAIVSAAKDQVSAALRAEDPSSPFTLTRDQLVNQAIIDSYLVRLTRAEASESGDVVHADELHRSRMRRVLEQEKTDADVFRDALRVYTLVDADDEDVVRQTFSLLREMLAAREPHEWLRQDKVRRVAILSALVRAEQHDYARQGIAAILRDSDLPEEIVSAALAAAAVNPAEDYLEPLKARCAKKIVEPRAYAALAAVDPSATEISTFVDGVLADDEIFKSNREAAFYLLEAWLGAENLSKDLKPRAANLLAKAVDRGGLNFMIPADDDDETPVRARGMAGMPMFTIKRSALVGGAALPIVQQALDHVATTNDDRTMKRFVQSFVYVYAADFGFAGLPSLRALRRPSFIAADLTNGGRIVLVDGRVLTAPGATAVEFSVGPRREIIARWRDGDVPKSAVVREFRELNRTKFVFEEPSEDLRSGAAPAVSVSGLG